MGFGEWMEKCNDWLNNFVDTLKNLPNDEKISWGSITIGSILVLVAVILW